jgi:hypothetical protein
VGLTPANQRGSPVGAPAFGPTPHPPGTDYDDQHRRVQGILQVAAIKPIAAPAGSSRSIPTFDAKMPVIDPYLKPPADGPAFCADENTCIQILQRRSQRLQLLFMCMRRPSGDSRSDYYSMVKRLLSYSAKYSCPSSVTSSVSSIWTPPKPSS